jgi:N-acetylglucosaminyldiphosphoundecaprenol N-acetyl-beta-D-mannosaminyltransferase
MRPMEAPLYENDRRFHFGGLQLAVLDLDGAVRWIVQRSRDKLPASVVTPNINHLHLRRTSPAAQQAIDAADMQLADGWPLILGSRLLDGGLPGRIAGIDLVERLVDGGFGARLAILGGPGDSATILATRAASGNSIVLVDELSPGWERSDRLRGLRDRLREAAPDLVLIGVPAPRGEILARQIQDVVQGPVVNCGAAVEVLAGFRPRAPQAFQRLGMEWAFRLGMEPRRLARRYLVSAVTFLRVMVAESAHRQRAG